MQTGRKDPRCPWWLSLSSGLGSHCQVDVVTPRGQVLGAPPLPWASRQIRSLAWLGAASQPASGCWDETPDIQGPEKERVMVAHGGLAPRRAAHGRGPGEAAAVLPGARLPCRPCRPCMVTCFLQPSPPAVRSVVRTSRFSPGARHHSLPELSGLRMSVQIWPCALPLLEDFVGF